MGYFGKTSLGTSLSTNTADTVRVTRQTLDERGRLGHVSARLAGGGGATPQVVRPVVYKAPLGALVGYGDPFTVPAGMTERWVELLFPDTLLLDAGDYDVGLHFGAGNAAQWAYSAAAAGTPAATVADTYADGPAASFPGGSSTSARDYAIWGHYRIEGDLPEAPDDWVGQLGWWSAQEVFGATPVVPGSAVSATAGWHGEAWHSAIGAFAIVRSDGPLAELVGQRLRVSYADREAFVYCTDESDIVEDISLARRAFAALALLSTDELIVTVEVMT